MKTILNFIFENYPPHDYPVVAFLLKLIFYPGGFENTELLFVFNEHYQRDWTGNLGWFSHHLVLGVAIMLAMFAITHVGFKHDYKQNFKDLFLYQESKRMFLLFAFIAFGACMAILGEPITW